MPCLRDDLLKPIPGDNPSGANLRYSPIYDKIKEARFEDEDSAPQGEWQHERKKADFLGVINMAGEALANQTKDLQLAAWLAEAGPGLARRAAALHLPSAQRLRHPPRRSGHLRSVPGRPLAGASNDVAAHLLSLLQQQMGNDVVPSAAVSESWLTAQAPAQHQHHRPRRSAASSPPPA